MGKTITCPKWTCDGIGIPIDTKKKFSVGKAVAGNVVGGFLGPAGAIAGTMMGVKGKNGKTTFVCQKCGNTWKEKV